MGQHTHTSNLHEEPVSTPNAEHKIPRTEYGTEITENRTEITETEILDFYFGFEFSGTKLPR